MGRIAILLAPLALLASALAPLRAEAANAAEFGPALPPLEMQFTKGDTRQGSRVNVRVTGDSIHYSKTVYEPGRSAVRSTMSAPIDARRRLAMRRIMGELPRFNVFGSCFGKGMRYYLIDTPGGKFYRSLPEHAAGCFADEPGIWPLLEDLDTFISPPDEKDEEEAPELSAAVFPAPRG